MQVIWKELIPPLDATHIAKLAVGPKEHGETFGDWERILSEIIVGDSFGVDRMDYLLRDSLHAGVVYGKFDQYRLIDTIRVLPETDDSQLPALGIEAGGLESAEALLLARYFMYSQVYFHSVRRVYDVHLKDFLVECYGSNTFPTETEEFLDITDDEVMVRMRIASKDPKQIGHDPARRIIKREHYKLLYSRNPIDLEKNPEAARAIFEAAKNKFGDALVKFDSYRQKSSGTDFPVRSRDGRVFSSVAKSEVLKKVPVVAIDYVFVAPEKLDEATRWLEDNREKIITQPEPEEEQL